jgi:putative DNA primase/helicase
MTKKNEQRTPARSDAGNAELFAALFRDRLRFDHKRQQWFVYRDHWWTPDSDGELMRMAKHAVRFRLKVCAEIEDADRRTKEVGWTLTSESRSRLDAMVTLAQSERPLADDGTGWDADGWLLGVANGVVELKTGKLRAGNPADGITLHTTVAFDPNAQCPRWMRFLDEIFGGDSELIQYVWHAVGYSLTGETSEQCFFCCYGDGANGKSTFLNAIRHTLGTYAANLPFSAFELAARSAISNDVATLPGKRFATAIETDESSCMNVARIKALTGGDIVTARLLYREFSEFRPVAKFWLAFNHRPVVTDDSHGFWRRVHLIPFLRQFDPHADPHLEETLRTEAIGILAWAVRGCLAWRAQGLNPPSVVRTATQAYRTEADPLRDFLEDRCILDPQAEVSVATLREAYVQWTRENGERNILTRLQFSRRLEAMGLQKRQHGHSRTWTWFGIQLRGYALPTSDDPPAPTTTGTANTRTDADAKIQ